MQQLRMRNITVNISFWIKFRSTVPAELLNRFLVSWSTWRHIPSQLPRRAASLLALRVSRTSTKRSAFYNFLPPQSRTGWLHLAFNDYSSCVARNRRSERPYLQLQIGHGSFLRKQIESWTFSIRLDNILKYPNFNYYLPGFKNFSHRRLSNLPGLSSLAYD